MRPVRFSVLFAAALASACRAPAPREDAERAVLRAENVIEAVRARLLAPGGLALARSLVLPLGGEPRGASSEWESLARGFAPSTRVEPPLFLALSEEEGTDLFRPNQGGFAREGYLVRVATDGEEPTFTAEVWVSPAPVDLGWLAVGKPLLVSSPVGSHLRAFDARAVPTLEPDAALWDAASGIERAEAYGELAASAVLRRSAKVSWWPGRRRLELRADGARLTLVRESAPATPSGPFGPAALVGSPNAFGASAAGLAGYAAFVARMARRRAVAYAASGDGHLHAFDAATGAEAFALRLGEADGGDPSPVSFDDVYVDARWATGGEPCPAGFASGGGCQWRTLVAVRTPAGGLVVLDVTQPDAESSPVSVPDCLSGDSRASGFSSGCTAPWPAPVFLRPPAEGALSVPAFGRIRWSATLASSPTRSVLVAGVARSGSGGLVVLDAATGETLASVDSGFAGAVRRPIGAVTAMPAVVDGDGDGLLDAIWFGDRAGSLWRVRIPRGPAPLTAELVFDGAGDPRTAGPIEKSPAVFRDARGLRVAFASRAVGGAIVSIPDLPGALLSAGDLAWLDDASPALGGCGMTAPPRDGGWALAFAREERVATGILALSGYLYAATVDAGGGGELRVRRLASANGDPCSDGDCCGPVHSRRLLAFPGVRTAPSEPHAAVDAGGVLRLLLVAADERGALQLISSPLPIRAMLRHPRSR